MKLERKTGLILALDVENETAALALLNETLEYIDAVKIGYQLLLAEGLHIVGLLKRRFPNLPIIADLKIMDAPHIALSMTRLAIEAGSHFVTISGLCGPTVIERCTEFAKWRSANMIIFVEFTQKDGLIKPGQANELAVLAKERGAYGILAPGTKLQRIRELRKVVGADLVIISCGIGAQGSTPGSAIKAGVDFEIVGRSICAASNPRRAAGTIADSLSAIVAKQRA